MAVAKIPISFNDDDQAAIKELVDLMGITGVYGDTPKALKFGIRLALSAIKNPEKVYGALDDENLKYYFDSLQKSFKKAQLLKKAEIMQKAAEKV